MIAKRKLELGKLAIVRNVGRLYNVYKIQKKELGTFAKIQSNESMVQIIKKVKQIRYTARKKLAKVF